MQNKKNRIEKLEADSGVKPGKFETSYARAVCRLFGGDPDRVPGVANIERYRQAVVTRLDAAAHKSPELIDRLEQFHREEINRKLIGS